MLNILFYDGKEMGEKEDRIQAKIASLDRKKVKL